MQKEPMSEEEREAAFPVHLELGEEPMVLPVAGLGAAIPKSGCALVDYTLDDEGNMVVTTLCLPDPAAKVVDEEDEEEDEPDTLEAALGDSPIEEEADDEDSDEE
jgi:hypothetical protein